MNQYDKIASQYDLTKEAIAKKYSYGPTLIKLCNSLKGLSVLDVACGTGYSTRLIQENCEPKRLVGLDSSAREIMLAKQQEAADPKGIEYITGKVESFNFNKLGKIDVITALFLLHYSPTKIHLFRVCKNLRKALTPKGKLIMINSHPLYPAMRHKEYEVTSEIKTPPQEGAVRTVTYWRDGHKLCSFKNYYWTAYTYKQALLKAGFKTVRFSAPIVSKEGYKKFGRRFWKNYTDEPHVVGIEGRR